MWLQPSHRHWRTLLQYLTAAVAWVLVTDLLFGVLSHVLSVPTFIYFMSRSAILFALSALWFYYSTRGLRRQGQLHLESLETSNQPIFLHKEGRWIHVNPAGLKLIGAKSEDDILGKPVTAIVQPEDCEIALREEFESTRKFLFTQRRLMTLDGRTLTVEATAIPLQFQGRCYGQVVYNDVTSRLDREKQLAAALSNLESFIQHNTDAVVIFDEDGQVTKVNPAFEELFDCSAAETIGKHMEELPIIVDSRRLAASAIVQQVTAGESVIGRSITCQTASGTKIDALLSVFPLRKVNGAVNGWSATVHNISQHKQDESRLLRSEKLAAVGQLAAGLAHEIKNPLTTVMGFVGLMTSSSQEKQKQYAQIMLEELKRIATIVNELLMLAKPQSESMTTVKMADLMHSVYSLLEPEAVLRDVEFSIQHEDAVNTVSTGVRTNSRMETTKTIANTTGSISGSSAEDCSPAIFGLENRLKQLFINLIRNAMDALAEKPRRVAISFRTLDNKVVVKVQDTGIGLSPEYLDHLGEPFFTTKEGGTGLGLFLCQQIVSQHHGNMEFHSTLGEGTVVQVAFPLYFEPSDSAGSE